MDDFEWRKTVLTGSCLLIVLVVAIVLLFIKEG